MKLDSVVAAAIQFGRGAAGDAIVAWKGDMVYCLSYDRTVCLQVRHVVPQREDEVSFRACDYEGPECGFKGKHVVFILENGARVRVPRPPYTFNGLDALFTRLRPSELGGAALMIERDILPYLDDSLPHVEFRWDGSEARIIQRDIYSGKILDIERRPIEGAQASPLAMRTGDFMALFGLHSSYRFQHCGDYFHVTNLHGVEAVVGGCLYDDLGKLHIVGGETDGGQESEGNAD
jgi:hypothetical protein